MIRQLMKSKIHRLTVTDKNLDYEGSITIDKLLLQASNIMPYELVHVVNVSNGNRFETYAIEGMANSNEVCLNGAAARLCEINDVIIVISYAGYNEAEIRDYKPIIIKVSNNKVIYD